MACDKIWRNFSFVLLVLTQTYRANTKIISGEINTRQDWTFMTRFCFKDSYGQMQYHFEYPKEYEVQNILLYFDTQWPKAYKPELDCIDKEDKLYRGNNQVINLTLSYHWSGCNLQEMDGKDTLVCKGDRRFLSLRARWWYIALSNCKAKKGLKIKYFLNLTNGNTFWTMHFSADEREIIKTDIFFLIMFIILILLTIHTSYILLTRRLFHYTFKLFLWSEVLEFISLVIYIGYYVDYGKTGQSKYIVQVVARVFHYTAHIVFLVLIILLAKGWTVTRGRISSTGQVKLSVFCTLYAICFVVLFIFEAALFDPGKVLYIYESPAGIGICVLRVIAWLWFCYGTFFTLKHYPSKSAFYYPFWFFYTAWFLAGPVIVVVSTFLIASWAREQVVNGIEWTVSLLAHFFFLIITRPTQANRNFPFHIRTNQIGIINMRPQYPMAQVPSAVNQPSYSPTDPPPSYGQTVSNFSDIASMFTASSIQKPVSPQGLYRNGNVNNNGASSNGTVNNDTSSNGTYPMMPVPEPRESPA